MDVVHARCAGLDVHKKTVVACVMVSSETGVRKETRTYRTMTRHLRELSVWLRECKVSAVVLESTGVYWWPVFSVLEGDGLPITVANAHDVKGRPGHKTDVGDAQWLADLVRHDLVRASFIPPAEIRTLRELTRYRTKLAEQKAHEVRRLQKVLESANIKLGDVASNVMGVSGQHMLQAIAQGEDDPEVLAAMARGRLAVKKADLVAALEGRIQAHHRLLLRVMLEGIRSVEQRIGEMDRAIQEALAPFASAVTLLEAIPGIGATAAATIIAEIGVDMTRFATAQHLASWAGVCPGSKRSGGRTLSAKTTKGDVWLRRTLGQCAWAAVRQKDCCFGAQFKRIVVRQGKLKAIVAVSHRLLLVIHHVLLTGEVYTEFGPEYVRLPDPAKAARRHVARLESLGYEVTITPKPRAA